MAVEPLKALFKITGPSLPIDEIIIAEDKPIRFGRTTDNDFELPNREISRQHLRLFWRDGNVWAEDLNSANGVWVNDVRVRPGSPSKLQPGDVIRIGPFLLTYTSNLQQEIIVKPLMDMDSPTMSDMPAPRDVKPVESGAAEKAASSLLEVFEPTLSGADLNIAEIMRRAAQEAGKAVEEFAAEVGIAPMTNLFPADTGVGSDASLPPDDYLPVVTAEKEYPIGTPTDRSNWLQYLPSIYQNDEFIGRYLLVFESMMNPLIWTIDNLDQYLATEISPTEWLQWMGSWFDLLIVPQLPIDNQRRILAQLGWLFFRRGTRVGLQRLLELYFGVSPEISEPKDEPCHFVVKLALSSSTVKLGRDQVDRLITSQKPAFASYRLDIS